VSSSKRAPGPESADPSPTEHAHDGVLLLRALEALGGSVVIVDTGLRVVAATRSAERMLGTKIRTSSHIVRVLAGNAGADLFVPDRVVVVSVPTGDPSHEERARVRVIPLRDQNRHVGWVLRLQRDSAYPHAAERFESLWALDEPMKRVFSLAQLLAECDVSVVVSGEMGVGKASLAAAIHARSARHHQPLRMLTCAGMTPLLLQRQLLGRTHREPAACTLLLDEVGALPNDTQGFLLRVLESGVVTPVDGGALVPVDVRTLATTSASLDRAVELGTFRPDLLMRLRTVSIEVPPLRARRGDVALLAEKFVAELNARGHRRVASLSDEARARLEDYVWPGNVRELRVVIEAAFATGKGPVLGSSDLPPRLEAEDGEREQLVTIASEATSMDEGTRLRRALERAGGDRGRAAAMLGLSRTTLWRRMRAHGLVDT
jgi:DNA-binding NtrC family response regulator